MSHWFLRGLGLQFTSFADTRMAMDPIPDFRTILHQVIRFDIMHRAMEESASVAPVAFVANDRNKSGHGQSYGSVGTRNLNIQQPRLGGNFQGGGTLNGGRGGRKPYIPRC